MRIFFFVDRTCIHIYKYLKCVFLRVLALEGWFVENEVHFSIASEKKMDIYAGILIYENIGIGGITMSGIMPFLLVVQIKLINISALLVKAKKNSSLNRLRTIFRSCTAINLLL